MPFDMHAMPGTKADFRALAIKFDSRFNKAPSTFDDYLTGLLRFKQGARETNFYRDLVPRTFHVAAERRQRAPARPELCLGAALQSHHPSDWGN